MGTRSRVLERDPWRRSWEAARERLGLELSFAELQRAVEDREQRARRRGRSVDPAARLRHAEDLVLAVACDRGEHRAWEALVKEVVPVIRQLARRWSADVEDVEEEIQDLLLHLQERPASAAGGTRLGGYEGGAALSSWLLVVLRRRLLARRISRDRCGGAPGTEGPAGLSDERTPEKEAEEKETVRRFGEALRRAWARLTPREALVLLGKYRDGMSQRRLAEVLRVGEPRVSRLIQHGLDKLRAELTQSMPTEAGSSLGDEGWHPLCTEVLSALQASGDDA